MGKIGTVLGDAGISIENMQIAQDETRETATVLMNVDKPVAQRQQDELVAAVDAKDFALIEL